jgi:hypothetical protein
VVEVLLVREAVAVAVVVLVEVRGMVDGMRVVGGWKEVVVVVSEGRRSSAGKVEEWGAALGRGSWDPLAVGGSESGGIDGIGTSKRIGRRGLGAVL